MHVVETREDVCEEDRRSAGDAGRPNQSGLNIFDNEQIRVTLRKERVGKQASVCEKEKKACPSGIISHLLIKFEKPRSRCCEAVLSNQARQT